MNTLLNWDHEINPTTLKDLESNVANHIAVKHGWGLDNVSVELTKNSLEVQVKKTATFGYGQSFGNSCDGFWSNELKVDFSDRLPREITGRVINWLPVGLYDLADMVKAA